LRHAESRPKFAELLGATFRFTDGFGWVSTWLSITSDSAADLHVGEPIDKGAMRKKEA
jgi:hypothetical protein